MRFCHELVERLSGISPLDQELHVLIGEYCGLDAAFLYSHIRQVCQVGFLCAHLFLADCSFGR